MNDLEVTVPKSWTLARIDEVVDLVNGFAFKPSQWQDRGLPIIRIQNLNNRSAPFNFCSDAIPEKYRVRRGDLLFAWSGTPGTSFGAHVWNGDDAWLNQHIFRVDFDRRCLDTEFLRLSINNNLQGYINASHGGAGLAHITKGRFQSSKLLLAPISEQRRIVAKIEALQARSRKAREALEAIPPLLEQFRQSVLAAAFRGDLTADWREQHPDVEPASVLLERIRSERRHQWEQAELAKFKAKGKVPKDASWRERYVEPEPADESDLPALPDGWCWASIEQIGFLKSGKRLPKGSSLISEDTGYPYVRAGNLKNGTIQGTILYLTESDYKRVSQYKIYEDDLYLTIVGASIGDTGICPKEFSGANLTENAARVQLVSGSVPDFLGFMIRCPQFDAQIQQRVLSAAQGKLALQRIKKLCVPVCPLEEQNVISRRLMEFLARIETILGTVRTLSSEASTLDEAILAKAFRGELVPQDPNDEPASVLLERIQAERAVNVNGKPSRGRSKRTSGTTAKTASDDQDGPAASNGKREPAPAPRRPIADYTADELMPHFRSAIRGTTDLTEDELLRDIAQRLGFERLGPQVRATLQGHLRAAIRRGIIHRDGDYLQAATPTFQRYSDDQLLKTFTSVMRPGYEYDREEVIRAVATHLGYSQVTPAMRARMKSIFNMAIRRNLLTRQGPTAIAR